MLRPRQHRRHDIRLWKILKAGNAILSKEKVKRSPFVIFTPLAVPHKLWGVNFAARYSPPLLRGRPDAEHHETPPWSPPIRAYTVLNGGVPKPEELKDNRLGGLVNITKPDAVKALEQYPLNPFTFQTDSLLGQKNEETTGISRLSQGLNKDAISKQNSADLVEQLDQQPDPAEDHRSELRPVPDRPLPPHLRPRD